MMDAYLDQLKAQGALNETDSRACAALMLSGNANEGDMVSVLGALADAGETVDEVVGFASEMRSQLVPVALPTPALDVCGTGGSGKDRFNVSTAAAFVLSAAGVPVAKHGNRGSRKGNGSFDFLEGLDIPFDFSPSWLPQLFLETDLCFIYARLHHPGMAHVAPARKALGRRSIFNLLGPLASPAKVRRQIVGTTSSKTAYLLATALQRLGAERAIVVVGGDGYDELSIYKSSVLFELCDGVIQQRNFDPSRVSDLEDVARPEFSGGLGADNASLFQRLLDERDARHPVMKSVLANAGLGFYVFDKANSPEAGYALAKQCFLEGEVAAQVSRYRKLAQGFALK